MILAIFDELKRGVARISVQYQQSVVPNCLGSGMLVEMPNPTKTNLLIGPSTRANTNDDTFVDSIVYPRGLDPFSLKDDKWWKDEVVSRDALNDRNPVTIPCLRREGFFAMPRSDDLASVPSPLRKPLLIHIVDIFVKNTVGLSSVVIEFEPLFQSWQIYGILHRLIHHPGEQHLQFRMLHKEARIPVRFKRQEIPLFDQQTKWQGYVEPGEKAAIPMRGVGALLWRWNSPLRH